MSVSVVERKNFRAKKIRSARKKPCSIESAALAFILLVSAKFSKLQTFVFVKRPLDVPLGSENQQVVSANVLN